MADISIHDTKNISLGEIRQIGSDEDPCYVRTLSITEELGRVITITMYAGMIAALKVEC